MGRGREEQIQFVLTPFLLFGVEVHKRSGLHFGLKRRNKQIPTKMTSQDNGSSRTLKQVSTLGKRKKSIDGTNKLLLFHISHNIHFFLLLER